VVEKEVDPEAGEKSIVAGLGWLERHQFAEGMWSSRSYMLGCSGTLCLGKGGETLDVAVTALAVLAILESGYAHAKLQRESAERALRWMASRQDSEGCFGPREGRFMYGHALATLAFARAYRVLGDPMAKVHASRGVRFLEAAQNPGRAWRYGVRDGENDTSVSVWAGAALAAAAEIEIEVRPSAVSGLLAWLDEVTGPLDCEVSYLRRGGGPGSIEGRNDHFDPNAALTALAAVVRFRFGTAASDRRLREAVRALARNLPVWDPRRTSVDFVYWFAGARAVTLLAKPGDEIRRDWCVRSRRLLTAHQREVDCTRGSWDPIDKWGEQGGRVYATAMNVLTLSLARD